MSISESMIQSWWRRKQFVGPFWYRPLSYERGYILVPEGIDHPCADIVAVLEGPAVVTSDEIRIPLVLFYEEKWYAAYRLYLEAPSIGHGSIQPIMPICLNVVVDE